jgi:hypothetical protein
MVERKKKKKKQKQKHDVEKGGDQYNFLLNKETDEGQEMIGSLSSVFALF